MNTDIQQSVGDEKTRAGSLASDAPSVGGEATQAAQQTLLGRIDQYELLRELGGGGFGVVFLARDTISDIEVAVKGLPPMVKNNAEELEQIRKNFALVSKLHHPNIASALVLHPARDVQYVSERTRQALRVVSGDTLMVMTYAPGMTLSKWRKQFTDGIVPLALSIDICRQIAAAIDYAHTEKVIHRDIKPANIMIETRRGLDEGDARQRVSKTKSITASRICAKVLDFGLAAEIRSSMNRVSQVKGDTSGTRPYMAPEQWAGKKQDGRTDQYALAVLFYELVSGTVPFASAFETGDPIIMMTAVETRTPEPLACLSPVQNQALLRALSKRPDDRFATCSAFVEALSSGVMGDFSGLMTHSLPVWLAQLKLAQRLQAARSVITDVLMIAPPLARFFNRVSGVLLQPVGFWKTIRTESLTVGGIYRDYLCAIVLLGFWYPATRTWSAYQYSAVQWLAIPAMILHYGLLLGALYVAGRVASRLARRFSGQDDRVAMLKVITFSLVPVSIAAGSSVIHGFAWFSWLGWAYAAYLLYHGLLQLSLCPSHKAIACSGGILILLFIMCQLPAQVSVKTQEYVNKWSYAVQQRAHAQTVPAPRPEPRVPPVSGTSGRGGMETPPGIPFIPSQQLYPGAGVSHAGVLPSDVWLPSSMLCVRIQCEFPEGSSTNMHVVFGVQSQSTLDSIRAMMLTNGWKIVNLGMVGDGRYGGMRAGGFSASYSKGQRRVTLERNESYFYDLVIMGPREEDAVKPPADTVVSTKKVISDEPEDQTQRPQDKVSDDVEQQKMKEKMAAEAKRQAEEAEARRKTEEERLKQEAEANRLALLKEQEEADRLRRERESQRLAEEQRMRDEEARRRQAAEEAQRLAAEQKKQDEEFRRAQAQRSSQLSNYLSQAKQQFDAAQWGSLLVTAQAALELDDTNPDATMYRDTAYEYLNKPFLKIETTLGGKKVAAKVLLDREYDTPVTLKLVAGEKYPARFYHTANNRRYEAATVIQVTPDWKGERTLEVPLLELKMPKPGEDWVSPSTGMAFVWVPALNIWVGQYEVTNGEYRRKDSVHDSGDAMDPLGHKVASLNEDRQPVVYVHFNEAKDYAAWLTRCDEDRLKGYRYRLPTQQEFTAFIQCGNGFKMYPWGNDWPPVSGKAGNYDDETLVDPQSLGDGYQDGSVVSCAVEKSGKNAWGLFGVGGNVWEACAVDKTNSDFAAWRGASWNDGSRGYIKCDFINRGAAALVRDQDSGFRLVLAP